MLTSWLAALLLAGGLSAVSCKNKAKEPAPTTTAPSPETTAPAPAPVEVSPDDQLIKGVNDAIKDYPGVSASVSNGEVTLTGSTERAKLPALMQSLHSLNPSRIDNSQLTLK